MAVNYTEEQLNNVDKSFLIQLLLQQQEQLNALTKELHASNEKMQLLMEQVILGKQNRFGRSSEKMEDTSQICFREVLWSSIFVTLMANKIGGLQFGIYRNCQISSRVFHTAVAALPLTKANRSDFE